MERLSMNPWLAVTMGLIWSLLRPTLRRSASAIQRSIGSRVSADRRNPRTSLCWRSWIRCMVSCSEVRLFAISTDRRGVRSESPEKHCWRTSGWVGKMSGMGDTRKKPPITDWPSMARPSAACPGAWGPGGSQFGSRVTARASGLDATSRWKASIGPSNSPRGETAESLRCSSAIAGATSSGSPSSSKRAPNSSRNSELAVPEATASRSCSLPRRCASGVSGNMSYSRQLPLYDTSSARHAWQASQTRSPAALTSAEAPSASADAVAAFISAPARE